MIVVKAFDPPKTVSVCVFCFHRLREQATVLQVPLPAQQNLLLCLPGASSRHDIGHHAHGQPCAPW
jgi:hypothetical protein